MSIKVQTHLKEYTSDDDAQLQQQIVCGRIERR